MSQITPPSPSEERLVRITRYVSPRYVAEFDKIIESDCPNRPSRIVFKDVKEDNILDWLEENALCQLRGSFSGGSSHSDIGYFFMGEGGAHLVVPSYREVNPVSPFLRGRQNFEYERRLTIKSQPARISLFRGFSDVLRVRGFQFVKEFKD